MESRFERPVRLRMAAYQAAYRRGLTPAGDAHAFTITDAASGRAIAVMNAGHRVELRMTGLDGVKAACAWEYGDFGYDTEVNVVLHCINAWVVHGRVPSVKPARRIASGTHNSE